MSNKEIAIYASLYTDTLDIIENALKENLSENNFKRIEQGTVLIYDDSISQFSIEYYNDSFYLTGRVKNDLENGKALILRIAESFSDSGMRFSLDYQEENLDGEATSPEFNISNQSDLI